MTGTTTGNTTGKHHDDSAFPPVGPLAPAASGELLLTGVRPYGEGEDVNVLVRDGVIAEIGADVGAGEGAEVLDFDSLVLLPGLVDIHVHMREPGREDTETLATGSAAAARGGLTAVLTHANTAPVTARP